MVTLIIIGLLGGLITGVSPCILPMLPIIFFAGAGGATSEAGTVPAPVEERTPVTVGGPARASSSGDGPTPDVLDSAGPARGAGRSFIGGRPLKIIFGLIVSFTVFTLTGSVILSALGLPQSFLRWAGITVLAAVGIGLMVPKLEELLEKPFYRLPKIQGKLHGNPFIFGLGLARSTSRAPDRCWPLSRSPARPVTSASAPSR
jgi:cytochrome c biogenesis protein CcdA